LQVLAAGDPIEKQALQFPRGRYGDPALQPDQPMRFVLSNADGHSASLASIGGVSKILIVLGGNFLSLLQKEAKLLK
jgi:hypothetical protein